MSSLRTSVLQKFRTESRRKDGFKTYTADGKVGRKSTKLERHIFENLNDAETLLKDVPNQEFTLKEADVPAMKLFVPQMIEAAVFCGHVVTDLDSVGGAIGAAALYGGIAATASDINSETEYALKRFGCDTPRRIEEIMKDNPGSKVCLVDHQQTSQMNPAIPAKNVCGIIDHHALQNKTVVTDLPIYVDIRPWGSMSTIIGHSFLTQKKRPSKAVAGVLLCAILSDTLNLQGPTTTDWDKVLVTALADIADIEDIDELAVQQFQAKSRELANLSSYSLVNGDQKAFSFDVKNGFQGELGFAVIETIDDEVILQREDELIVEMVACKVENSLDLLFLAVVNIIELRSQLILCGPAEASLAKQAYGGSISRQSRMMDTGGRVSRKKDFIPAVASAIQDGWKRSTEADKKLYDVKKEELGRLEIQQSDPYGQVHRLGSSLRSRAASEFLLDE